MYGELLKPKSIKLEELYLDPNNPRFFEKSRKVNLTRYTENKVQAEALKSIKEYSITDLVNSILMNGFLQMDRIVVKAMENGAGYYALEGNRRLAALKELTSQIEQGLIDETEFQPPYIDRLSKNIEQIEVLVYSGDQEDISWMLQGIRHISGIKDWSPTQRAKLVSDLIENQGADFSTVGKKFGLSAIAVGRLYRGFKGLQQMQNHHEHRANAKNSYFSLFEEAHKNKDARKWLGWDENTYSYTEEDNFSQFCMWISPDEEEGNGKNNGRRIHDPKHVRLLGNLVNRNREDLISEIDGFEITIEQAWGRAEERKEYDWAAELHRIKKAIANIPMKEMTNNSAQLKSQLSEIRTEIDKMIELIRD